MGQKKHSRQSCRNSSMLSWGAKQQIGVYEKDPRLFPYRKATTQIIIEPDKKDREEKAGNEKRIET